MYRANVTVVGNILQLCEVSAAVAGKNQVPSYITATHCSTSNGLLTVIL